MAIKQIQATINGQTVQLSYNEVTRKYEGTLTAPNQTSYHEQDHKFGITLKATDMAGNVTNADRDTATIGENLKIRVLEKTKPVVTITSPSSGARVTTGVPPVQFKVTDEVGGSGVDFSTLSFIMDDGEPIGSDDPRIDKSPIANGFSVTYTPTEPLDDGSHTVKITVNDFDGNVSDTATSSFTVDTQAPALNVTAPQNNLLTNQKTITVTGTATDSNQDGVRVTISVNDSDAGAVELQGTSFTKQVTLTEGLNTIKVTAIDSSGLSTVVTRTVTLDTIAPKITSVTLNKDTTDVGTTFTISVEVTD